MAEFSEKRGLRTQWSEAEIPECPLGEYPRPQFMRPSWLCLNGRWDYAVVPNGREPEDYRDRILVPFSPETALSGAGRGPGPGETSWYRRTFTLPAGFMKDRLLLHFGAVDQSCEVYVNGRSAGTHEGGYTPFTLDVTSLASPTGRNTLTVAVRDETAEGAGTYGKQSISPRRRLRASGIRPINNIVDITNYVMLEYGQPMHSFDYRCISGSRIVVRTAAEGEEMATLDGSPRALNTGMLVIADDTKPIGLAGIMGGQNSEITEDTASVVFESANFSGPSIRRTAITLGMRTDASSRFEKGLDPLGTLPAVERACELVELLGAGEVVDGVIDVIARDSAPTKLKLEPEKIDRLLGVHTEPEFMKKVLTDLGFTFEGDMMTVPSWRGDVSHYSDIAEEVARFYGYDVIPATAFKGTTAQGGLTAKQQVERDLRHLCRDLGFSETLTYSFMGQSDYDLAGMPKDHPLRDSFAILNPLGEDSSIMRTTLLPSILKCMSLNAAHRNKDVKLFDLSKVYLREEGNLLAREEKHLSLGVYGEGADFFALKGCVEAILRQLRVPGVRYEANKGHFAFHPGRCADILAEDGAVLGTFGELHPNVRKACGISSAAAAAELNFELLWDRRAPEPLYQPLPRFPAVLRDLALVCEEGITVHQLRQVIAEAGGKLLQEVSFFDVYRGAPIPAGKKSVAFSLSFRKEDSSLTDAEIEPAMSSILRSLEEKLQAKIR